MAPISYGGIPEVALPVELVEEDGLLVITEGWTGQERWDIQHSAKPDMPKQTVCD